MTSFISIAVIAVVAICLTFIRATPYPQQAPTPLPPSPPQQANTTEGLGEKIGKFVDQMVQHGKDTIQKFIPQGTKGVAVQGAPQVLPSPVPLPAGVGIPPVQPGLPVGVPQIPAVQPVGGLVGEKVAEHGFAGHLHNAACRNATS